MNTLFSQRLAITQLLFFACLLILCLPNLKAQQELYKYAPSPEHPFGLPNPDAPPQLLDWHPLIGESQCKSVSRNPDQTWADTVDMIWKWKYILNGLAVQDETLKSDGRHGGSLRQYIADSSRWYVHFYNSSRPSPILPAWEGNKNEDGDIILYKDQKAPNGMEGYYKINFTDIENNSFDWLGEWVDKSESISFPTWKIFCIKTSHINNDIGK